MTVADGGTTAKRRRRASIAIASCIVAVGGIIALAVALSENVVFFQSVSEAIRDRDDLGSDRFRMGGEVVAGTVHETADGVRFRITDGTKTAEIVHRGDPPELFNEDVPVLCEGHWGRSGAFRSDRILIRHGAEYTPPKVKPDEDVR
jgi:cytochrome c-type biogenesis protein CcmE